MSLPQYKPGQPVVGFNHNINYKGRVFHVQTEDSGPQHGHIITHLFMGGNILASTKSSYADTLKRLDPGEIFATVRKLMEDQHKAMMKSLTGGAHDEEIARRTSGPVYEPGVLADGQRAPGLLVGGEKPTSLPPKAPPTPAAPRPPAPVAKPAPPPPPPPQATPARPATPAPMASSLLPRRPLATGAPPSPPVMVPSAISMTTPVPPPRSLTTSPGVAPKSLDEIILSYLSSTDADGKRR